MKIFALGDLHLSFGVPNKGMDKFGKQWENHPEKIKDLWQAKIQANDIVLLPGDISWAMTLEEVMPDLLWIDALPGKKVMIKGNHDYWWNSFSKVEKILPSSIIALQNNAYVDDSISIGGARLWDSSEYDFMKFIEITGNSETLSQKLTIEDEKIFERELGRLELSLKAMKRESSLKIVMTHYPPIGPDLLSSKTSQLLEKYGVHQCVFGHLHSVRPYSLPFGKLGGIDYHLTSCDYLNFDPLLIASLA